MAHLAQRLRCAQGATMNEHAKEIADRSNGMGHRGWKVVESTNSADGQYCVDLFIDAEQNYGWAHFRADPEDTGGWTLLTRSSIPFESCEDAGEHAVDSIRWYSGH